MFSKTVVIIFYVQFEQTNDIREEFSHFHLKLAEYEGKTVNWLFEPLNEKNSLHQPITKKFRFCTWNGFVEPLSNYSMSKISVS